MLKNSNIQIFNFIVIFIILFFFNIFTNKEITFYGKSIGTIYKIKILNIKKINNEHIKIITNNFLSNMNKSLSIYNKMSEVNYFNISLKSYFSPSNDFLTLFFISKIICDFSEGTWNPNINSINYIWQLNQKKIINKSNYIFNIHYILDNTDLKKIINIKKFGYLKKKNTNILIDFSSIAKGFIVDHLTLFFKKNRLKNFLIEIGGEIYAKTTKKNTWEIGIFNPKKKINNIYSFNSIFLNNKAMATSGNYYNFVKYSKIILPHIINPISGNPISNLICSVSIIANNCTVADSFGTILMLVNPKDSIYIINSLEKIECIIIIANDNGIHNKYISNGFFNI